MSNKSIDGLRRRNNLNTIGLPEKNEKKHKVEVAPKAARRRVEVTEAEKRLDEKDEAIRDFLSSVQDDDPTNLVSELPEKRESKRKQKGRKVKQPKEKKRKSRIVLRVLGILLLVIIAAGVWLYIQGNEFVSRVTGGGNLWNVITAAPDVPLTKDPVSGRTNILIFGTEGYSMDDPKWAGGQLTDSMMVASLDQDSGDIRTISIPRDLKAKTCSSTSKFNEIYVCSYGKNKDENGAARELARQAGEVLGIEIQYFIHVNWQAVVQVVDDLDGIDVAFIYQGTTWTGEEVALETTDKRGLRDYYSPKTRTWGIDYKNGEVVHLNGEQALGVARSRNSGGGYGSGSNFSREQFQQKIIQAAILKAKKKGFDFITALNIKNAVGDNVRMDFKDTELKTLFGIAGRIDMGGMKSISIQDTDDGSRLLTSGMLPSTNGQSYSYVYPVAGVGNYTAIHAYVKRKLSSDPRVVENARIIVMNATSASGVAGTEGTKLKEKGYNVTQSINAPAALGKTEGVKVYQVNKSMSGTAEALKKLYGDVISTTVPEALTNYSADFIVVLGDGYATTTTAGE